jgi:hypothetical protein
MLNSRRREATAGVGGTEDAFNNNSGTFGVGERYSTAVGPSGIHGSSGLNDQYSNGPLGPSALLDRSPFSSDFTSHSQNGTTGMPLIQYDTGDDEVLVPAGRGSNGTGFSINHHSNSPKDGPRFDPLQQSSQQQQQSQNNNNPQQPQSKFAASFLPYGALSHDFLERVSTPNSTGGDMDHFAQQQQQQQQDNLLRVSSQSGLNLTGSGLSSRSSLSNFSMSNSARYSSSSVLLSGALSPPSSSSNDMSSANSSSANSRSLSIGNGVGNNFAQQIQLQQQQHQQQQQQGLGALSTQDLGWLKDELERSSQQQSNSVGGQSQHLLSASGMQTQFPLPPPSSIHHQRVHSNSAPGSTRSSTNGLLQQQQSQGQQHAQQQQQQQLLLSQISNSSPLDLSPNGLLSGYDSISPLGNINSQQQLLLNGIANTGIMDDVKLKKYKTVMCQRMVRTGGCRYAHMCDFAHDRLELRRNLDLHWYYAVKCEKRACMDAECRYSHNDHEIMYHPRIYKTRLCTNYAKPGGCNRKMYCSFAHGKFELRFHANPNLLVGGPGNMYGLLPSPPPINPPPPASTTQQQQSNGTGVITNNNNVPIIPPPGVLPPSLQSQSNQSNNNNNPQQQQQQQQQQRLNTTSGSSAATLTIAGGQAVLPRELVASLQASGINISAPSPLPLVHESPSASGLNNNNNMQIGINARGSTGSINALLQQQGGLLFNPNQQQSQQQQQSPAPLLPSTQQQQQQQQQPHSSPSGSPRPSQSSPLDQVKEEMDTYELGLGHHHSSHSSSSSSIIPTSQFRRDSTSTAASPEPLLSSAQFAQLGLSAGHDSFTNNITAHAHNYQSVTSASLSSSNSTSVAMTPMPSPNSAPATTSSTSTSMIAPVASPISAGAGGMNNQQQQQQQQQQQAVAVGGIEQFREHTDALKIRILDLVDEVAQMHFARALEEQTASLANGQVLKVLTANLQTSTSQLNQAKTALGVYIGDEATLAAMSLNALDALTAHANALIIAVANAKAKLVPPPPRSSSPINGGNNNDTGIAAVTTSSTPGPGQVGTGGGSVSVSPGSSPASTDCCVSGSSRCMICHESSVGVLLWPCTHKVLCNACSTVDLCPQCIQPIQRAIPLVNELPSILPFVPLSNTSPASISTINVSADKSDKSTLVSAATVAVCTSPVISSNVGVSSSSPIPPVSLSVPLINNNELSASPSIVSTISNNGCGNPSPSLSSPSNILASPSPKSI